MSMKKWIFGIVCALLLGSSAGALAGEPACFPFDGKAVNSQVTIFPNTIPAWLAEDPTKASGIATAWCPSKYGYTPVKVTFFKDEFLQIFGNFEAIRTLLLNGTHAEKLAVLKANRCSGSACDRYKTLEEAARDQLGFSNNGIPVIEWVTAKNSDQPSRPTYAVSSGVRSKTASPYRVAVGVTCDMKAVVEEGASSYGSVSGLTRYGSELAIPSGHVALCVLKK